MALYHWDVPATELPSLLRFNAITAWGARPHAYDQHGLGFSCRNPSARAALFLLPVNYVKGTVLQKLWTLRFVFQGHLSGGAMAPSCSDRSGQGFLRSQPDQSKRLWKCQIESQLNPNWHRLRFVWKFWKCRNQLAECCSAEINLQGQRIWKHVARLRKAQNCVSYQRIRPLWVGCHGWWGSKRERQPPARRHRQPRWHKACGGGENKGLSAVI